METFVSILFPLVWVCTCLVAAIGFRLRQQSWPQAMVIASMMAATVGICGGSQNAQIGVAFVSGLLAFFALDLRSVVTAANARKLSGQAEAMRISPMPAATEQPAPSPRPQPASQTASQTAPKAAPMAAPKPARAAPLETQSPEAPPGSSHPGMSRYERERLGRRGEQWAKQSRKQGSASPQSEGPVEVILPAERAVLRRHSSTRGYWIAKTVNGEVEVYLPPGAEAYPGRPVSLVVKSNGTLLGVPVVSH